MSEMVSRGRDASRRADPRAAAGAGVTPRPARGRWVLAGGAVLAAAGAGVAVAVAGPFGGAGHAGGGAGDGYRTALSTITRQLLRSQTRVNATLGYAGSYQVTGQGGGRSRGCRRRGG